ncbi:HD domain-containing protein [Fusobacteria bacterium ZRK30]|nr:HD domain-containing protein [Fusobacteria bacterium ZRK30]
MKLEKILGLKIVLEESDSSSGFDINPFVLSVNGKELNDEEYLSTEPYMQAQLSIFNREDKGYIPYFDDLEFYKIAVVEGSLVEKYLLSKGLKDNLIKFETIKGAMTAETEGGADILIGRVQHIDQFLKKYNMTNIKVAGILPDKIDLRFGVPKKDEILFFMINGFNNDFSYGIKINKKEFFTKNTEIAKDYKFSIIILLVSILGFLGIYIHLKRFKVVYNKLKNITIGLVETLESANSYNDEDTGAHIKRLNQYSELLAEELKLPNSFVNEIGLYASLHDIGKIGISDAILKKPGKLTEEEFEIMKTHIEIGYNLIKDLDVSPVASNIVRYHHEKWNGKGYGKGLKGEEIPVEARIVALSDVYDALRQERVYKKAFTHEKSMEIIISESGKHFDPRIVEVFIKKHEHFRDIFEKSKVDFSNKKNSLK